MDLLRHLRYFAAVAEEGHIGRAADRLNLAQPALSQRVKALELALGVALVEKDGRGIRVTEAGRVLGQRALALVDAADHLADDLRPTASPSVRFAVPATLAPERLAALTRTLEEALAPRVVDVVPLPPNERARALDTGQVHAAVTVTPAAGDVILALGAAVAPGHPLAAMTSVHPSDLNEEQVLVLDEDAPRRPQLAAQLDRYGLAAEWVEWGQVPVTALARAWAGAVCLTDARHARDAGLVWVPFEGEPPRRELELRWAADHESDGLEGVTHAVASALAADVTTPRGTAPPSPAGTLARIRDVWAAVGVTGSLHVRDLHSGAEFGIAARESWPIASVAKAPLVVALHRAAAQGLVELSAPVHLRPDGRTRGTTGVSAMTDPVTLSLRDAAYLAVTISDNAAADAIWDALGRDRVQAILRDLADPEELHLAEPMRDLYDRVEFGSGSVDDVRANRATPCGLTRLLRLVWQDQAASPDACAHVRDLLYRQIWSDRLASGFPAEDITVAGKTGTVHDHRHEIGVVSYRDGRAYAVAVLTRRTAEKPHHRWDCAIGETARLAVNAVRRGETTN